MIAAPVLDALTRLAKGAQDERLGAALLEHGLQALQAGL